MMKRDNAVPIVVTGGASQVGVSVLQQLASLSLPVTALQRNSPVPVIGNVHVETYDLANPDTQRSLNFDGAALIHVAGMTLLPGNLEFFADCGVKRIVSFSSTSIDSKQSSPDPQERAFATRLREAEDRAADICARRQLDLTILRPTMIYGLGVDKNISRAAQFIRRFGAYPLAIRSDGRRQPVHSDDLADAVMRVLDTPGASGRTYEVGGGEILPYCEMIGRLFDVLEKPRRLIRIPGLANALRIVEFVARRPGLGAGLVQRMGEDLICDNSAAIRDFGYTPRGFLSAGRSDIFPASELGNNP